MVLFKPHICAYLSIFSSVADESSLAVMPNLKGVCVCNMILQLQLFLHSLKSTSVML